MQEVPILQKGDQLRIISTARKITIDELQAAKELFESWGLVVSFGKHLFSEDHQFAGTKEERLADIQSAIDDPSVKAVVCARGGYGTVQLIDEIDFSRFVKHPKWLVGYSDVTVLHNHINQNLGIETLHATMPINFPKNGENDATKSLKKALFGEQLHYEFEAEPKSILNFEKMQAPIVGGNLSIIYSLTGTNSQISSNGKFLFMEDLDEYLYHVDRMMYNLKRNGYFKHLAGLIIGGMTDMNDNETPFGETAEEIIKRHIKEYDFPVAFGFPAGHLDDNRTLIFGRRARLEVDKSGTTLTFDYGRAQ